MDKLLVALMLAEIRNTVRISIRSHVLVTEPFLVMELDTLTKRGAWSTASASLFRASMIELGLLGLLVVALVFSITLLRRYPTVAKKVKD